MLPVSIFRNLRFSAASVSVTSAFFALFGFIFLITQYFQLVKSYTPLQAGIRTLPVAVRDRGGVGRGPEDRRAHRHGAVVAAGLGVDGDRVHVDRLSAEVDTSYLEIAGQMVVLGTGLGMTTAPATESIMGSLSRRQGGHRLSGERHDP